MKHWVKVKFDYSSDRINGYLQEIKTNHYFRDNENGSVLYINTPLCINMLNGFANIKDVLKEITQEEFEKVLKDTIDYMGINTTNHKFIKENKLN